MSTKGASYMAITDSGKRRSQKLFVLEILKTEGPMTRKMLARRAGMEVASTCRCVNDLIHNEPPLAKIAYVAPCQISGKTVEYVADYNWVNPKLGSAQQSLF